MRLSSVTLRARLTLLLGCAIVGVSLASFLTYRGMRAVGLDGPFAERLLSQKALEADVLPPPLYIVEPYLEANRLAYATDAAEQKRLVTNGATLERAFEERVAFWKRSLQDSVAKVQLEQANRYAEEFFALRNGAFLAAVRRGDRGASRALLEGGMRKAYDAHRQSIDAVVTRLNAAAKEVDAESTTATTYVRWEALAIGFAIAIGLAFAGWRLMIGVLRPLGEIRGVADRIDAGELTARVGFTSQDEIGSVGRALDRMATTVMRRDKHAQLLNSVISELATATTAEEAVTRVLEGARFAFGWVYSSYWKVTEGAVGQELAFQFESGEVDDDFHAVSRATRFRSGQGINGRAWALNELVVIPDLASLADCPRRETAKRAGVSTGIALPVQVNGATIGTLDFFVLGNPIEVPEDRRDVFRAMASVLGAALERIGRADEEREKQERLEAAVAQVESVVAGATKGDLSRTVQLAGTDAVARLAAGVDSLIGDLRRNIGELGSTVGALAASSTTLSTTAVQLTQGAEASSTKAEQAAGSASEVSSSMQTMENATSELSSSIGEISRSAQEAAVVAREAVDSAAKAGETVEKLDAASHEIAGVVDLIRQVAHQTNLLALNASIEAARAGEAGRGFAVVANEVKALAQQTADATDNIAARIDAMRTGSSDASTALREIQTIIGRIADLQVTISSAVEEQTATASAMARDVAGAARGSDRITGSIGDVAAAASQVRGSSGEVQHAATTLGSIAERLKEQVARYTLDGRRAA
ncbi:MAG: HAMP domain-containing protein [Gemmatimonadaceae bacterium]|nr:HAMP domain-containing protein [Gemmatimonadaceae bacterium]